MRWICCCCYHHGYCYCMSVRRHEGTWRGRSQNPEQGCWRSFRKVLCARVPLSPTHPVVQTGRLVGVCPRFHSSVERKEDALHRSCPRFMEAHRIGERGNCVYRGRDCLCVSNRIPPPRRLWPCQLGFRTLIGKGRGYARSNRHGDKNMDPSSFIWASRRRRRGDAPGFNMWDVVVTFNDNKIDVWNKWKVGNLHFYFYLFFFCLDWNFAGESLLSHRTCARHRVLDQRQILSRQIHPLKGKEM